MVTKPVLILLIESSETCPVIASDKQHQERQGGGVKSGDPKPANIEEVSAAGELEIRQPAALALILLHGHSLRPGSLDGILRGADEPAGNSEQRLENRPGVDQREADTDRH